MKKADQLLRVFRNIEVDESNMLQWQGLILPVSFEILLTYFFHIIRVDYDFFILKIPSFDKIGERTLQQRRL